MCACTSGYWHTHGRFLSNRTPRNNLVGVRCLEGKRKKTAPAGVEQNVLRRLQETPPHPNHSQITTNNKMSTIAKEPARSHRSYRAEEFATALPPQHGFRMRQDTSPFDNLEEEEVQKSPRSSLFQRWSRRMRRSTAEEST